MWKRVPVLRRLSHPHVLPFRGVNMTLYQLALVYDRGDNSNIVEYIASHPDVSRTALVRTTATKNKVPADAKSLQQLLEVAKGLQYLHLLDIPHGDIRGVSLLSESWPFFRCHFVVPRFVCRA